VIDERQPQTTFLALDGHLANMILNELDKILIENRIQLPNMQFADEQKKVKCGRVIMADDIWISKYIPKE
jgi:hypothetical protein